MSTRTQPPQEDDQVSGWAIGGIAFAGTIMVLIGVFQILAGLVAIFNDDFYVVTQNYTFDLDVTVWGWIHLLVGIALLATGFGLFSRRPWAGVAAIMLCMLSALVNFFFIPYYPIWSLLMIGLAVWVIWSVTRTGALDNT
jgi:cytochrome c oxidase subunit IV